MLGGNLHLFAVSPHQFFIMVMSLINFNQPHNAIKWCTHIMAHTVEKLRFSLISQLCLLPSCFQLLLMLFFCHHVIINIYKNADTGTNCPSNIPTEFGSAPHPDICAIFMLNTKLAIKEAVLFSLYGCGKSLSRSRQILWMDTFVYKLHSIGKFFLIAIAQNMPQFI